MSKTAVQSKRKQKPKFKVIVVETESPKPLPRRNPEIPPITTHPERLGGTPTIAGTRLPVVTLLDYLMEGATVQEFIDDFDAVSLGDVEAVLEKIKEAYLEHKFTAYLATKYRFTPGNSASGIDLPGLNVDIKVTSIAQPQS